MRDCLDYLWQEDPFHPWVAHSMGWDPGLNKTEKVSMYIPHHSLLLHCGCNVTSQLKRPLPHAFHAMMDCFLELGRKIDPFSLNLLLLGILPQT